MPTAAATVAPSGNSSRSVGLLWIKVTQNRCIILATSVPFFSHSLTGMPATEFFIILIFFIYRQYKQLVEEAVRQKKSTKAKYISCTDIIFLQYLGKLKIDVFDETKRECNIFFAFIWIHAKENHFQRPPRSRTNRVRFFHIAYSFKELNPC